MIRPATMTLVLVAAGCGGDDAWDPLADVTRPACPDFVHAQFYIDRDGDLAELFGYYEDWGRGTATEPANGCTTWVEDSDDVEPGPCGGACATGETCHQGTCVPSPQRMDIGVVRVTGIDPGITMTPTFQNMYFGGFVNYEPGDEITVSAGGDGSDIAPFALTVRGVPALTLPAEHLTYTPDGDLVVTWAPTDAPADTRVRFHAWSGGVVEEHVECWSDDTGQLTVPDADPLAVSNAALLERHTVGTAETEHGCAMMTTYARLDLNE